jgi:hypothetical protein
MALHSNRGVLGRLYMLEVFITRCSMDQFNNQVISFGALDPAPGGGALEL